MERVCYFICGPESSGNKMLKNSFRDIGIHITYDYQEQRGFYNLPDRIVFSKSMPSNSTWHSLDKLTHRIINNNYTVIPIVPIRLVKYCAMSQVRHNHVTTFERGVANIHRAIYKIYYDFSKVPLVPVTISYENFISDSKYREFIFSKVLDLDTPSIKYYNANDKYTKR